MEVCDLDSLDFVQYKPAQVFGDQDSSFVLTPVARDRAWFARHRPRLQQFLAVLHHYLHDPAALDAIRRDNMAPRVLALALGMPVDDLTDDIEWNAAYLREVAQSEERYDSLRQARASAHTLDPTIQSCLDSVIRLVCARNAAS